jgi:hypothetical protein
MKTIYWRLLSLVIATIAVCLIAAAEQTMMDLGPIPGKSTPFTSKVKSHVSTRAGDIIEGAEWVKHGVVE